MAINDLTRYRIFTRESSPESDGLFSNMRYVDGRESTIIHEREFDPASLGRYRKVAPYSQEYYKALLDEDMAKMEAALSALEKQNDKQRYKEHLGRGTRTIAEREIRGLYRETELFRCHRCGRLTFNLGERLCSQCESIFHPKSIIEATKSILYKVYAHNTWRKRVEGNSTLDSFMRKSKNTEGVPIGEFGLWRIETGALQFVAD